MSGNLIHSLRMNWWTYCLRWSSHRFLTSSIGSGSSALSQIVDRIKSSEQILLIFGPLMRLDTSSLHLKDTVLSRHWTVEWIFLPETRAYQYQFSQASWAWSHMLNARSMDKDIRWPYPFNCQLKSNIVGNTGVILKILLLQPLNIWPILT